MVEEKNHQSLRVEIPKTISQSIYDYLKKAICANEFKPNQKLNEKKIADIFQVSRTPVRRAIAQLAAEGLVEIDPHRESVVKDISLKEIEEILEVLRILDAQAVEIAMDKLESKDLEKLETTTTRMEKCLQNKEFEKYKDLNETFHRKLWSLVPNEFLRKNLEDCFLQFNRSEYARKIAFRDPGVIENSMKEHKEILAFLKNRDIARLKSIILRHWLLKTYWTPMEEEL